MARFDRDTLQPLLSENTFPCISIYLPIIRDGNEVIQTPIRLRTLLREIEDHLKAEGLPSPQIEKLLAPATELLEQSLFWSFARQGLAVFSGGEIAQVLQFSQPVPELVAVKDCFVVRPLLELDQTDRSYLVLAIGRGGNRVYRGSREQFEPILVAGMPDSLESIIDTYSVEKQRNQYGGSTAGATSHGFENRKDRDRLMVETYCRQTDTVLTEQFRNDSLPLVVAAVDNLFAIYRKASKYPHLIQTNVPGSPEHMSEQELHSRAWSTVVASQPQADAAAWEAAQNLLGSDKIRQNIRQIIEVADRGRVAQLFLPRGRSLPGRFDQETRQIIWPDLADESHPFALDDLLEYAAIRTLEQGGTVHPIDPDWLAADTDALAVLRF
jgi:hypothetical protein